MDYGESCMFYGLALRLEWLTCLYRKLNTSREQARRERDEDGGGALQEDEESDDDI